MFLPYAVLELVANRSFCFLRPWQPSYHSCGPMPSPPGTWLMFSQLACPAQGMARFDIVTTWCLSSFQSEFVRVTVACSKQHLWPERVWGLGREKEHLYFCACQEFLEHLRSLLIARVCLSCLPCPSISKILSCKILCAGEGTKGMKVLLAICQSNPLSLPAWCLQTDG